MSEDQLFTNVTYCHACQISISSRAIKKEDCCQNSKTARSLVLTKKRGVNYFDNDKEGVLSLQKRAQQQKLDFILKETKQERNCNIEDQMNLWEIVANIN